MQVTLDETVWTIESLPALWSFADWCEERGRDVPFIRLAFTALGMDFREGKGLVRERDAAVKAIPDKFSRVAACVFAARLIDKITNQRIIDGIIYSLCYCDGLVGKTQMMAAIAAARLAAWAAGGGPSAWAAAAAANASMMSSASRAATTCTFPHDRAERRWQTGFSKWIVKQHGKFPS